MMDLSRNTWVVVADGTKFLIFENVTDAQDPNLSVLRKREEENPPDREQKTDRPGRGHDNGPGHKSALAETDFHDQQKARFAVELAALLYRHAHAGTYEKLVVVASPGVLGTLRDNFHKEVVDRIVAEIPKTLTNHPVDEIESIVTTALAA